MNVQKKSHKEWRKNVKKLQRKRRRRLAASKRDEEERQKNTVNHESEESSLELVQLDNIQRLNEIEHEKWLESEMKIEKEWQIQKQRLEEQAKKKEAERRRIQEEFQAEQKRIAQMKEEKSRLIEEEKRRQIELENRILEFTLGIGEMPAELMVEAETNPGKELCSFFSKMAVCRFGNKCLKNHKRPGISKILLIHSFFTDIRLDQNVATEYGNDLALEHDERGLVEHFNEFFTDVVPEFEHFGSIKCFVASANYDAHHRGNVMIEYTSERCALKALRAMNGRFYAGRMLSVEFCNISWKSAICGLSLKNMCPKGHHCSFLHSLKNPSGRYPVQRAIFEATSIRNSQRNGGQPKDDSWNFQGETQQTKRNWRWSESPVRESIENSQPQKQIEPLRSRSRSRNRTRSRCRSRSHSHKKQSKKRDRKRSRSRSRSKKKRSHSKHKTKKKKHKKSHKS